MLRIAIKRKWQGQPLDGSGRSSNTTTTSSRVRFDPETADIPDFYSTRSATLHRTYEKPRFYGHSQFDSGFESFVPSQSNSTRGLTRQRIVRHSTMDENDVPAEPLVDLSQRQRPQVVQPGPHN